MAAPKYGTLVPNRIFVGGISASTSEAELAQLFSAYGNVKATKIISDRAGVSKGYGFVTFETEEEAKRLQQEVRADREVVVVVVVLRRLEKNGDLRNVSKRLFCFFFFPPPSFLYLFVRHCSPNASS